MINGVFIKIVTKTDLRERCRALREQMSDAERESAGRNISHRLVELVEELEPKIVQAYWPIERNYEVDVRPFIEHLRRIGIGIALPVVSRKEKGVLESRHFTTEAELREGRFGILEPHSGAVMNPDEIDLVVTPALAADRRGYRIGYGAGFYDRFLKTTNCPTAAVVYLICLMEHVPEDAHDVRMDLVITENETIVTDQPAT